MNQALENISDRLRELRKKTYHSKANCAKFLDIPVEQYDGYENDESGISLPELELLSAFFSVPVSSFYLTVMPELKIQPVLKKRTKSKYLLLRNKVILAKLQIELRDQEITIEELSSSTGLSHESLQSYLSGKAPVPMEHLIQISEALGQPFTNFVAEELNQKDRELNTLDLQDEQDESTIDDEVSNQKVEDHPDLLGQAIAHLSVKDQAEIAKLILNKIKTRISH